MRENLKTAAIWIVIAVVGVLLFYGAVVSGQHKYEEDQRLGTYITTVCIYGVEHDAYGEVECTDGAGFDVRCHAWHYTAEGLWCDGKLVPHTKGMEP
jgi:hypothetical protein